MEFFKRLLLEDKIRLKVKQRAYIVVLLSGFVVPTMVLMGGETSPTGQRDLLRQLRSVMQNCARYTVASFPVSERDAEQEIRRVVDEVKSWERDNAIPRCIRSGFARLSVKTPLFEGVLE